jgi:enoyl-CoA hydratase/carnithine racemase
MKLDAPMSLHPNETILLMDHSNDIYTLTLNLPEKSNALSIRFIAALQGAFDELAEDKTIKVIILAGNGPIFSSGHDLMEIREDYSYPGMPALYSQCSNMTITMRKQPQPIIAKVHRTAVALGCQLVSNCDLAVAANDSTFSLPGSNIGLFCSSPAVAVGRVLSPKHAMEMLLISAAISAGDAYHFGLIIKVVTIEELDNAVLVYAKKIARSSSMTMSIGKPAFYEQLDTELSAAYAFTSEMMARNMQEYDAQEGIEAFLENRHLKWRGR